MTFFSPFAAPFQSAFPAEAITGPMVYFYDTFTGADGTALSAHTPDIDVVGGGWLAATAWTIQSNQANSAGAGAANYARANVGLADVTVSAQAVTASGGRFGLVVRFVDTSNHWIIYSSATGQFLQIREITAATETQRAVITGVAQTVPFLMTVTLAGNVITATFGTNTVTYTSASHNTATRHGLYTNGANGRYDNFEIKTT